MKKKINFGGNLSLDKETIARLDEEQLKALVGGATVQSISCNGNPAAAEATPGDDEDIFEGSCCNNSCNVGGTA